MYPPPQPCDNKSCESAEEAWCNAFMGHLIDPDAMFCCFECADTWTEDFEEAVFAIENWWLTQRKKMFKKPTKSANKITFKIT